MNRVSMIAAACAFAAGICGPALAATVVDVPATGDLYLAGQPDGTMCCFMDSAPAESPVSASVTLVPGEYLTFSATGGAAHQPGPVYSTPDGDLSGDYGTSYDLHADYGTGISGPTDVHLGGLAGVFLGPATPMGTAPAQLTGTDFLSISPGLDQIFFIGDGLTDTGSGSRQTFLVPQGATRLFLGIIDDGGYYDNNGTITATITPLSAAPEPSTWALMILGLGGVGYALRRTERRAASPPKSLPA